MAGWGEILKEINGASVSPLDSVRGKYLAELSQYTGRNVIAYYSGFLTKRSDNLDINDNDLNGFMNAIKDLDCSKGLDLILHTPGGSPAAAEAIVNYIKTKFGNNFRIIVPQLAMSAGTMIACAGYEIVMGNQSSLGPVDPQFNGIPAYNIVEEFGEAKSDLQKNPANYHFWQIRLQQYPAAFLKSAKDAIDLSSELVKDWLGANMFSADADKDTKIKTIETTLNEHAKNKSHGRHFNYDKCIAMGLKIIKMEDDNELQDKILSVHHAFMITFNSSNSTKIIENHAGRRVHYTSPVRS